MLFLALRMPEKAYLPFSAALEALKYTPDYVMFRLEVCDGVGCGTDAAEELLKKCTPPLPK